jgi:hypothetical protein
MTRDFKFCAAEFAAFLLGAVLCHLIALQWVAMFFVAAALFAAYGMYRCVRDAHAAKAATARYLARTLSTLRAGKPVNVVTNGPAMRGFVEQDDEGEDYSWG